MRDLKNIPTEQLVAELLSREHKDVTVNIIFSVSPKELLEKTIPDFLQRRIHDT